MVRGWRPRQPILKFVGLRNKNNQSNDLVRPRPAATGLVVCRNARRSLR